MTYDARHPDVAFRLQGFEDALAEQSAQGPAAPPIAVRREAVARDAVDESLRTLLDAKAGLRCLVCFDNAHTLAAAQLLADSDDAERVVLVGFHPTDQTFAQLAAGRVDAVIAERPYDVGRFAVRAAAALCQATPLQQPELGQGNFFLRAQIVTRGDVPRFFAARPAADG